MIEQELKAKRLALLEETANHFNLGNRSVVKAGGPISFDKCVYSGQGCAIGRLIADKDLCRKLDSRFPNETGVGTNEVFCQLPEDIKELGQKYLQWIQNFHDTEDLWTDTGMSKKGIAYRDHIKAMVDANDFNRKFSFDGYKQTVIANKGQTNET